jgi:hypothetical protein
MTAARLTPPQFKALEGYATEGYATAHARTKTALVSKGLLAPVMGWYEKSIARRVGRYFATETTWGVTGYRITETGRETVAAERAQRDAQSAAWKRIEPGRYQMTVGETVVVKVFREPARRAGGMAGPDEWTALIYPEGCDHWCFIRRGHKTLSRAKTAAETAYRAALADIAAGRPTEQ